MRPGPAGLALMGSAAEVRLQQADKKRAPAGLVKGRFMVAIVAAAAAGSAWARCAAAVRTGRSVLLFALCLSLVPLLGSCAWLSAKQSQLALRPTPGRPAGLTDDSVLFRPGDVRWLVAMPSAQSAPAANPARPAQPDQLALWWLPHANPNAPTLLYLHGTFRNLYLNLSKIDALREAGYSVVAVDYRGWGDSTVVVPNEETITADARVAWAEMQRLQPDPARRVIFGHSLGGAVAVRLASTLHAVHAVQVVQAGGTDDAARPGSADAAARTGSSADDAARTVSSADYAALVLESTFTKLPDVAAAAGFWGRIAAAASTLEFDSLSRIGRIDAPLLMLHGTADRTVPVELGRRLRDAAPAGVRWIEIPGGSHSRLHSDAPAVYQEALAQLLHATKSKPATPSRARSQ